MKTLSNIPYVAVGAAIGGVLRYLATVYIQGRSGPAFPVATMLINISGSLLLGFLAAYMAETRLIDPQLGLLLTTGLCGGYTTFSTFTYETMTLMRTGEYRRAAVYITLSVVLGVVGAIGGFAGARGLIHLRRGI